MIRSRRHCPQRSPSTICQPPSPSSRTIWNMNAFTFPGRNPRATSQPTARRTTSKRLYRTHPYPTSRTVGISSATRFGPTEGGQDFDQLRVSDAPPPLASKRTAYAPPTDVKLASAIDTLETAIDFVLALEHPCMAHIPYPAESGGADPANHMMLVCCS